MNGSDISWTRRSSVFFLFCWKSSFFAAKLDVQCCTYVTVQKLVFHAKTPKQPTTSLVCKGQLISKFLFGILKFFQKTNEIIQPSSTMLTQVHFFEELKTPKRHFETNWPLPIMINFQFKCFIISSAFG
jgi:hypothetical protein